MGQSRAMFGAEWQYQGQEWGYPPSSLPYYPAKEYQDGGEWGEVWRGWHHAPAPLTISCRVSPLPHEVPGTPSPASGGSSLSPSSLPTSSLPPFSPSSLPPTHLPPFSPSSLPTGFDPAFSKEFLQPPSPHPTLPSSHPTYLSSSPPTFTFPSHPGLSSPSSLHTFTFPSHPGFPSSPTTLPSFTFPSSLPPAPLPSPPSSLTSSEGTEESVFFPPTSRPSLPPSSLPPASRPTFPPIQLKNNQSFTEAELKAITPWRNQLLERLLANRSVPLAPQAPTGPPGGLRKPPGASVGKPRPPAPRPGTALFLDPSGLAEFHLGGGGPEYLGAVRRGTTAFLAVQGAIHQANQGAGTVRAVVETLLKYCLPRDLAEYSLTGKSLQEKLEVRNGQAQSRVVMAERGSSKQGVPPGLLAGLVSLLEALLTEAGRRAAGPSLATYTRKLVSKTCSRSQERKNQEMRTATIRRGRRGEQ